MSEKPGFSLGTVLKILLTNTNCRSSYFANHYVYKDASLVSKWLHDTQFPTPDVFPLIVRFTMEKSNAVTRSIMRIEIDQQISRAGLDEATEQVLADIADFDGYLLGVLNVLANLKKAERIPAASSDGSAGQSPPAVIPAAILAVSPTSPFGSASADSGAHSHPDAPGNIVPRIPAFSAAVIYTILSAFCGETLWRLTAAAFHLSPVPGALGGVAGPWSFAWGLMITLPVMGFALLSLGRTSIFVGALPLAHRLVFLGCYCTAGGIAGFFLGNVGLLDVSPLQAVPPLALVFLCALVLSFPPLLSVYALLRRPKFDALTFLLLEFGPSLACTFIAIPFMLQPATRQAGDIFAGFVLSLLMFGSLHAVLQSYPDNIRFRMFGRDTGKKC